MTRFLNLASKALAVVGVLTLMYSGSGMQQAKADGTAPWDCKVATPTSCISWGCTIAQCCCKKPYFDDSHPAGYCCDGVCCLGEE